MTKTHHFVLALLLILSVSPAIAGAQSDAQCDPVQGVEICINNVSLSETTVTDGSSVTLNIQLVNAGNETGDAVILMGTHQPEGGYTYGVLKEVHNLKPGETKDLSLTLPVQNDGPSGVHEVNFMIFDPGQEHLYDATGYSTTLVIEENSVNLIQWLKGLHYTIQISIVVVPLLLGFLGWLLNG